jgi:hypothetical protein
MRRLFTAVLILTLCFAVVGFGQAKKWQFAKVFPDTNFKPNTGVHGIAVDKAGKIWIAPYGTVDSISDGTKMVKIRKLYVFNPDGTPTALSGIKTITTGAVKDTFFNGSRGMRADVDGNIVYGAYDTYWKINYQTGAGIKKVIPVAAASVVTPAFTSANEMFTAHVLPGNPINIWDATFSSLGTAIASSVGYSRTLEVSKDGNDIYWCGYTNAKVYKFHSANGTLGPYTLADSMAIGCQVESIAWNTKDGLLYASSGTVDTIDYTPPVAAPYQPDVWYGFNVTTKKAQDSIVWNRTAYPYPYGTVTVDQLPRPRGIAFSASGDTAYVATYNYANAPVQMFVRVVTSVEPVNNLIPNGYLLSQNYPNPFNPTTEIQFSIPTAGYTTVKVYDVLGKEVATLVNEHLNPGTFKTTLDASKLSSGTYVYTLVSGTSLISKKMMLLK